MCVLPAVDVFFDQGSLLFSSFCYANQIFDIAEYNKPVTQLQIDELFASKLLEQSDVQYTIENFNSWELKRLSSICASKVLDSQSIKDLKEAAKKSIMRCLRKTVSWLFLKKKRSKKIPFILK